MTRLYPPFLLQIQGPTISSDISLVSSLAVILGAIFVVFQIRQNNKLVAASAEQASASVTQAKLSTEQLRQNNELANMDMIMRLYEFANTAEVQSSWLTVLNSTLITYDDFLKLSKPEQIAFFQIAALFESLGVLVERGLVKDEIVEDMFATTLAFEKMKPFVKGMRGRFGEEDNYVFFEKLYNRLAQKEAALKSEKSSLTKLPSNL